MGCQEKKLIRLWNRKHATEKRSKRTKSGMKKLGKYATEEEELLFRGIKDPQDAENI